MTCLRKMERARGFEPLTASLEGWNSTTELRPHTLSVLSTESSVLSSETTPRRRISALSTRHSALLRSLEALNLRTQLIETSGSSKLGMVGRQGFEPWKPMATDLQSAPFVHLGTCPNIAKSLDSSLWAQKQTIPLTVPLFPMIQQEMTVSGWTRRLFWKQAILRTMSRYVKWGRQFF